MKSFVVQARAAMLRDVMAIASKAPSPTGAPVPKKAKNTKAVKGSAGGHRIPLTHFHIVL